MKAYMLAWLCALALPAYAYEGADWAAWRGPRFDGTSAEKGWKSDWSAGSPKRLWKAKIGLGCSAFAVAQGRAFTMGNERGADADAVYAFDAEKGTELWKHTYPCELDPKYYFGGPSATPVVDAGRVYTLSKFGHAFCLEAQSGKVVWQRNVMEDFKLERPTWGYAGSARIDGERLYLNVGTAGLCLEKATGKTVWETGNQAGGYSTPVLVKAGGKDAVANFTAAGLTLLDRADGKQLAQHPWKTQYDCNAADPLVLGDAFFISSDYGAGCALVKLEGGAFKELWRNKAMSNHMNPCVLHEGLLFGGSGNIQGGALVCLDAASGALKWSKDDFNGQGILADGKVLYLTSKGLLVVFEAQGEAYKELGRTQAFGGTCYTAPVLSHGLLYCRNGEGDAVCFDLRP